MGRKRITADQLGPEIAKILEEYGEDVERNMREVNAKIGRKGATAVKNAALEKFGGTGEYAKGWRVTSDKKPHYVSTVIYNGKRARLTHLLENGHALVKGGRKIGEVDGRPHIGPVEEEIMRQYEIEVLSVL